ncbi:MAG: amidohydrolase family protein [Desulfurococcales archaeon]|nr:amidohydrolase family protein [Desulfurococcales archaeon]
MPTLTIETRGILNSNLEFLGNRITIDAATGLITGINKAITYAKAVHLDGYIFPGFIDAHMHLTGTGLKLLSADLGNARNPEEIGRRLAELKRSIAFGRGWDQEAFDTPGVLPTRRVLDKYVHDRPAIAVRVCGHMAVANTEALRLVEPYKKYPDYVDTEKGILIEDAVEYTVNGLLERNGNIREFLKAALNELAESGIAGVSSMSCPPSEYDTLLELSGRNELIHKISCYPDYNRLNEFNLVKDNNVSVAGVKLFADGSFGAHTAALEEPYEDKDTKGRLLLTSRDIVEIAGKAVSRGLRVATHAIGDQAISEVLDAYEKLGINSSGRIEHFSLSDNNDISRASALGIHVVVQPYFRIGDWWLDKRLGRDRALNAYRFKTMIRKGVKVSFSTDSPVDPYQPWETLRASYSDCSTILCRKDEALNPEEAFHSYTVMAAMASGGTVSRLGRIEVGSPAGSLAWSPSDPTRKEWRGLARLLPLVLKEMLL